jgi:hypothetical protein
MPPIDANRATLVTTAMLPFYNHGPPNGTHTYCRTLQGSSALTTDQTSEWPNKAEKERSSEEKTSTGPEIEGLGIPHLDNTIRGFQRNLVQKIHKQRKAHESHC